MKAIMSLAEFAKVWQQSHPSDVVTKEEVKGISWWSLAGVLVSLIAANILSAAHTIPVIVETVKTDSAVLKVIVAIAGFLAVEFVILMFMIFGKSGWIRAGIISLALTVAIVANVVSTVLYVTAGGVYGGGGVFVGIVLGLFAPLANVGIGEVFRGMLDKANGEVKRVADQYEDELKKHDAKILGQYNVYLKKMGVTDATEALTYIREGKSNDVPVETKYEPVTVTGGAPITYDTPRIPKRASKMVKKSSKTTSSKRGAELARLMQRDGTQDLNYKELREKYGASPNTISEAKKLL
jgi:hypothetical protein